MDDKTGKKLPRFAQEADAHIFHKNMPTMSCPYCNAPLNTGIGVTPGPTPFGECLGCGNVFRMNDGPPRKLTDADLADLGPDFMQARALLREHAKPKEAHLAAIFMGRQLVFFVKKLVGGVMYYAPGNPNYVPICGFQYLDNNNGPLDPDVVKRKIANVYKFILNRAFAHAGERMTDLQMLVADDISKYFARNFYDNFLPAELWLGDSKETAVEVALTTEAMAALTQETWQGHAFFTLLEREDDGD